jgi:hypothetical protein
MLNLEDLGANIYAWPQRSYAVYPNVYYELALGLVVDIILALVILLLWPRYLKFWLLKSYVAFFVIIYQEALYGLDAYYYYTEALYNSYAHKYTGTGMVIHINHLFSNLVGDSYFSLKIFNAFIGFLALILLYQTYQEILRQNKIIEKHETFLYVLFLFPSILLFSTHIGKDTLNLFLVALFLHGSISFHHRRQWHYLLYVAVAIFGVYYIRVWWPVIMLISILLFYFRLTSLRHFMMLLITIPIFTAIFLNFLSFVDINSFEEIFVRMNDTLQNLSYGGSATESSQIAGLADYLLYFVPNAFTAIFRPLPFDITNPLILLAALENTFLLYFFYKYILRSWRIVMANPSTKFLLLFIFSWSLFYVIISPGNLGMAIRFKLQILPAMLMIFFIVRARKQMLESKVTE